MITNCPICNNVLKKEGKSYYCVSQFCDLTPYKRFILYYYDYEEITGYDIIIMLDNINYRLFSLDKTYIGTVFLSNYNSNTFSYKRIIEIDKTFPFISADNTKDIITRVLKIQAFI